ncbi:hypothetical protein EU522_00550 [Candidatus Thorarchaeota archaeon]|nr:MAG: hypothetical protein EU522_00550 [Candidatus Thorarchaeota archaeon]
MVISDGFSMILFLILNRRSDISAGIRTWIQVNTKESRTHFAMSGMVNSNCQIKHPKRIN